MSKKRSFFERLTGSVNLDEEIEEEKESKIEGIKYWSPSASMVSSSEINKLRQSLTEYKK